MLSIPGYAITETVYVGDKTLIYRAIRERDRTPVILKTLADELPSIRDLARLRHEYILTKDLDGIGLPRAYELLPVRNTEVLVLRDIGGSSIKRLLSGLEMPVAEFLTVALAFAKSLEQIHQLNIIHKDINPSNFVVNALTGNAQIIDFGIASRLSSETTQLQNLGRLEGTLAYISPEQTGRMNRTVDYRTDFYSLGASFYEMLTGTPPFPATDPGELVHSHLAKVPVPPHELRPELARSLSQLTIKLMAKAAEDRYQTAWGVIADLEACARQFDASGTIEDFPLGKFDVSDQFRISQKLYGREREVQHLLDAFTRVSQGQTEMLLVAGYSGVGKTALVHEVHKPITEKQGYFINGKFDQFQRDIPYASLIQAFQELMRQLITESPERLTRWKSLLHLALGTNAQVIVEVIPELELILGPQVAVPSLSPQESRNRFETSFRLFIEVFAKPEHPLVLFLDDLQWADPASLRFLEELLLKSREQCLLILGTYRDNEVHAAHPFMLAIEGMQKAEARLSTLTLKPLSYLDLAQLMEDTLSPCEENPAPLARLVFNKTAGNPFFVNAFLTALHETGLIRFIHADKRWSWDAPHIEAQQITDNVVELMSQKLRAMPAETQDLLVRAACIGHQFELKTLAVISEQAPASVIERLWSAVNAGLIQQTGTFQVEELTGVTTESLPAGSYRFRFIHDRIQQAAYGLVQSTETATLHLSIGRLWQQELKSAQEGDSLFSVLNQFQAAVSLITSPEEKLQLAELNLLAGRRAVRSSAFSSASRYLSDGLSLINGGNWEKHYDLTLALSLELAQCEYLNHRHQEAELYFQASLKYARTALTKSQIHLKQLELFGSQGDYKEPSAKDWLD